MATVQLIHSSRTAIDTGNYRWWPAVAGTYYDFNGNPWNGGAAMTNEQLKRAHEIAREMELEAADMYWGTDALQVMQDEDDASWAAFMAELDRDNDWDVQLQEAAQRVYPGSF